MRLSETEVFRCANRIVVETSADGFKRCIPLVRTSNGGWHNAFHPSKKYFTKEAQEKIEQAYKRWLLQEITSE